ncbi:MAG: leucyl aminopeptidase [Chloroflexi bacterium]|nr:leucyl aminopeptidase [Chloroflexota bacterium]
MEISAVTGDIATMPAGAIMVGVLEGEGPEGEAAAVDQALEGAIARLISQGEIKGKQGETTVIYSLGKLPAARVAVVGLGKRAELSMDKVRGAVAEACRTLKRKGVEDIATVALGSGKPEIVPERSAQAITEGAMLGLYAFRNHITVSENNFHEVRKLTLVGGDETKAALEQGIARGTVLSQAANAARDMVNEPANFMTPSAMAEAALKLGRDYGLEVTVLEREQMAEMGMGGLLGVSLGSRQPPKFIIMRYTGSDRPDLDLALAGKGITFDSGGISIKPSEGMGDMKGDMAGGAAVMMALAAIARLKARINVMSLIPATENMPGGNALRPGDILSAMSGKTMEIISTDAEGRLILADALSYATRNGAKAIIDVATLTGACRVALGTVCSGAFCNNQELLERFLAAARDAGEPAWQLPMYAEYREQIKSDVADIKNVGGRYGGAITAAKFLEEFVGDTPWVHLDIAGTSMSEKERFHLVKGATGVPVRTLVNLALAMS